MWFTPQQRNGIKFIELSPSRRWCNRFFRFAVTCFKRRWNCDFGRGSQSLGLKLNRVSERGRSNNIFIAAFVPNAFHIKPRWDENVTTRLTLPRTCIHSKRIVSSLGCTWMNNHTRYIALYHTSAFQQTHVITKAALYTQQCVLKV